MGNKDWKFCVVGNIVKQYVDENGETRYGSREFVGGTKVYIDGKNWANYERTKINVIGLNRFHRYEIADIEPQLIENVRLKVIYKKTVIEIIDAQVYEGWYWWGRTAEDKRQAKAFVENWENLILNLKK